MSNLKKFTVPIKGMHCKSCEILVEDQLKEVRGINKVLVNRRRDIAEIYYDKEKPELEKITEAVIKAGYSVGEENAKGLISKNLNDYKELGLAFLFLFGLYFMLKGLGVTNIDINPSPEGLTVWFVLLVGLTAGVSTCMALVGGLILGLSAKHNEMHPEATPLEKFRPHLFFNLGRILGYAFLGGLLGILGSTIQLSSLALGILTIAVGLIMLTMGLQLVEIFPWANKLKLSLPKSLSRALGMGEHQKEYSHKNSAVLGALTFFLPCGFTQAMQVFAIGTGNFFYGALVMGLFALGTVPGLLGVGGLVSAVKGSFAKKFFKFSGLVIIAFAIFNISNGFGLAGWNIDYGQAKNINISDPNVVLENGVQVVRMKETNSGYSPNNFTIKKGVPVKWVIDAEAPFSCASSIIMSKYNIRKNLVKGENIIEFTPTETGRLPFSCSMGMYTGVFNVVDENGAASKSVNLINSADMASNSAGCSGGCGGDSGGGCSCGGNTENSSGSCH
ncbi:MAG: sulfite exporter TauE/SafE family protein [Candidatus Falkowbacteria bacterium]